MADKQLSEQGRAIRGRQYAAIRRIGWLVLTTGLLAAPIGGWLMYRAVSFSRHALPVEATAVDIERHRSTDDEGPRYSYSVTFVFEGVDGQTHRVRPWYSSSEFPSREGSRVDILYDQRDPSRIAMKDWFGVWGPSTITLGVAVFLLLVGLVLAAARPPKSARPAVS
ncbi:MAG: DUF3592 domain-containing protein [Planctomycetota bacterium]